MKSTLTLVKSAWWASVAFTFLFLITSFAFSQDVPKLISYQGILQQHGVNVNGEQIIRLTLYSDVEGKNIVWQGSYNVDVKDGIFSVLLGSGKYHLPESKEMDKQLYLGIALLGENEMRPLTQLSSSAYALNIPDKSITANKLSDELTNSLGLHNINQNPQNNDNQDDPSGDFHWAESGNRSESAVSGNNRDIAPPNVFLGTRDENDFEIHLNDDWERIWDFNTGLPSNTTGGITQISRVLRLERGLSGTNRQSPNIIVGFGTGSTTGNRVVSSQGSSITGGGKSSEANTISSDFSHIGGGSKNVIAGSSSHSVISGGFNNDIAGTLSSIAGGNRLKLGSRSFGFNGQTSTTDNIDISSATNLSSQVAFFHEVDVVIGNLGSVGRKLKFYEPNTSTTYNSANFTSFKAVAQTNDIEYSLPASLGSTGALLFLDDNAGTMKWTSSGTNNQILKLVNGKPEWAAPPAINLKWYSESNATPTILPSATGIGAVSHGENVSATGNYSNIGGGELNSVSDDYSTISGGKHNISIGTYTTMGGGADNKIEESNYSLISGGSDNLIQNGSYSLIIGGNSNKVYSSSYSVIAGGIQNEARSGYTLVGGGELNKVRTLYSSIVGGERNLIQYEENDNNHYYLNQHGFIGGGKQNKIEFIPTPALPFSPSSVTDATIQPTTSGSNTIAGGHKNQISRSHLAFIGGGYNNIIHMGVYSTIGGGVNNQVYSDFATIPGGDALIAQSWGQTVIGRYNKAKGTTYKSLDINDILTNHKYDPLLIVGKGWADLQRSNAFEVTNHGASMVYAVNGPLVQAAPTYKGIPRKGATYTDNIIYAWGIIDPVVPPLGTLLQEPWDKGFGIRKVEVLAGPCPPPGNSQYYKITLNVDDQEGNPINFQDAVVTVNVIDTRNVQDNPQRCGHCPYIASVSKIDQTNSFTVRIFQMNNCAYTFIEPFQFMVTGRP